MIQQENKMGTHNIIHLLITMSIPPAISMLTSSLYNIVDSIFIASLGNETLTAVSLAFPIQMLIIAIAVGSGIGVNSYISRTLGAKNYTLVNNIALHGIILSIIHYLFLSLLGLIFIKPFFSFFTINTYIFKMSCDYIYIVTFFSIGIIIQIGIEKIFQATGNTLTPMFLQIIGAITNIILDPIMIYGYFGFPKLGIKGAAIATICGQFTALFCSLYLLFFKAKEINLNLKNFKWNFNIIKNIYAVAVPSFFIISLTSFMVMGINYILTTISLLAVSIFGIYYKVQTFIFMATSGVTQGAIPIMGYNYGAKNKNRLLETLAYSIIICIGINILGTFIFWIFPKEILYLFNPSIEIIKLGIPALRIISLSFPFGGICFILACFFQATGKGGLSLLITLLRQFIFLLPLGYFLGNIFHLKGVWISFLISDLITCIFSIIIYRYYSKNDELLKSL